MSAVLREATFNRLCRYGVWLHGAKHDVDAYEEVRPNASVHAAVGGGILLLLTTRRPNPGVLSAQVNTKRQTTGARSKGAKWEEAVNALMQR